MRRTTLLILILINFSAFGQTNLTMAIKTPLLNGDSLANVLLDKFVANYNSTFEVNDLLENRYQYLCATFDWEINKTYFIGHGKAAIIEMDERVSDHLKWYAAEERTLKKNKRKFNSINASDFELTQVSWSSGEISDSVRNLQAVFEPINKDFKLDSILFDVHFFSEDVNDGSMMNVVWVK